MPTCCKALNGYQIGSAVCCKQGRIGGITDLLIACACDIATVTVTDGIIGVSTTNTGFTWVDTTTKFKRYEVPVGGAQVDITPALSDTNGYIDWTTTLTINFQSLNATLRNELQALADNNLAFIYADNNRDRTTDPPSQYGCYWYVGPLFPQTSSDGYVNINGGTLTTGRVKSDANQAEPTLSNTNEFLPYPVNPDVIDALIATT